MASLHDRVMSSGLVRAALDALERGFGGPVASDHSAVRTVDALSTGVLVELFQTHRACAIHVPGFCSRTTADQLARWIVTNHRSTRWRGTDMAYALGVPFRIASQTPRGLREYALRAPSVARRLRHICEGASPFDRLRLELDEAWPNAGAMIADRKGFKMLVGLSRVMTPDDLLDGIARTEGVCHRDSSALLSSERGKFSANIYLEVPDAGGDLAIWPVAPTRWDWLRNHRVFREMETFQPATQAFVRSRLPPPLVIKPAAGDLILLNTGRPHAVRGFHSGRRVTLQTFVTHEPARPLTIGV